MSLDFPHTCSTIDSRIEIFKDEASLFVESFASQFIPSVLVNESDWKYKTFIEDWCADLESKVLPLFEDLRELNSDMRDSAEKQLNELQETIGELEWQKQELEEKINMLQEELYNCK